jgi:16S rRNA (cytosine1402-N4)-methyltransferase
MQSIHKPVLLHEVVNDLVVDLTRQFPDSIWYLDATLGGAGHALAIAKAFNGKINVIGLDNDEQAIR